MPLPNLATLLKDFIAQVDLKRFPKQPRKKEKNKNPLVTAPKQPHVSTTELLALENLALVQASLRDLRVVV